MPKMRFLLPLLALMLLLPSAALASEHLAFPKTMELYWVIPLPTRCATFLASPLW